MTLTAEEMAIIALVQRAPAEPDAATCAEWYAANPIDSSEVADAIHVAQAYHDACLAAAMATPSTMRSRHRRGTQFPGRDAYRDEQIRTLHGENCPVIARLRQEQAARYAAYVCNEWPIIWARRMYAEIVPKL